MGIRILIADDAPFIREVLRNIILKSDFDLIGEAEDGEQAIEMALELKPDVILMDIVMPNKSGLAATEEILISNPQIKIIACSTLDNETTVMKALEAGCCNYIAKPFTSEDLLRVIRTSVKETEATYG